VLLRGSGQSSPNRRCLFFLAVPATTRIYSLSLHDALPISVYVRLGGKPMPFLTALRLNMPGALVWAIFTPAAIWLGRRYPPFEGPHWPRGVAVNLVASAAAVFLEVLLVIVNQRWIRGPMPSDD